MSPTRWADEGSLEETRKMYEIRKSDERGRGEHGWLSSRHTFSFAGYYDPRFMGFGPLRVINEDRVEGGGGFPPHPHRDMEILSYVIDGGLEHRDSMGNGSVIKPGEVQRMSAGSGVVHSEYNASRDEPVHFLQIWILPESEGEAPGYEQQRFPFEERSGTWRLLASRDGREGSVTVRQDVELLGTVLPPGVDRTRPIVEGRKAWLQVVRGDVVLDGQRLEAGDGVAFENERALALTGGEAAAELLLFELPQDG